MFAHADKGHFFFETCESTQVGRNQHAACLVNREINGAAEHDALQKARAVGQCGQRFALFLPTAAGINQKTPVGVARKRHFKRARHGKSLAMPARHRHAALRIKRK